MSIILDKVNYVYSAGTAYEVQALKDINLKIEEGGQVAERLKFVKGYKRRDLL